MCRMLLLGLLLLAGVVKAAVTKEQSLELLFLDVGQGSALLLHQPGECRMLIDAGPLEQGASLVKRLAEQGVSRLDRLIISHPHIDHYGGVFALPTHFPIGRVNDNGRVNSNWIVFEPYRRWRQRHAYDPLQRGDRFDCGPAELEVLWPPAEQVAGLGINDGSLVMRLKLGRTRVLLVGDIGPAVKTELMAEGQQLGADILLVSHHGGDQPLDGWLEAVGPKLAVISVGADNRFGSPKVALIESIKQAGIELWRTDQQGSLKVEVSADGYRLVH